MPTVFNGYKYQNHILHTEGLSLKDVAAKVGTPAYIYSSSLMTNAYEELEAGLQDIPHLICYAVKANSNIAIIRLFGQLGAGADIVSAGELYRCLEAGIPAEKIVFSGVGKTKEEIDYAIDNKILMFNVESEQELLTIDLVAKSRKQVACVSIRVNPDVNPKTHPYIATGLKRSKFGIPYKKAPELIKQALKLKNVHVMGLSCHIGSQITSNAPFVESTRKVLELVDKAREWSAEITHLDVGGGLGITYKGERPPSLQSWAKSFSKEVTDRDLTLVMEPGRSLVGNAGVLLTKVINVKRGEGRSYVIVDTGMNDIIRPSLYEAEHSILPVQYKRYKKIQASIVGPICESGDIIKPTRRIPNFQSGDLLAIMSCGAYVSTMGSQYNSRPKPPEILLKDGKIMTIRERETFEDLIAHEKIPSTLKKNQKIAKLA